MVKLSIVKSARIECITPDQLKGGDLILWSNNACKVISITGAGDKFALIQLFPEDSENMLWIPKYANFYRILDCEMEQRDV